MAIKQAFARMFRLVRGRFRARPSPGTVRLARLGLEQLEERAVLTAVWGVAWSSPPASAPPAWPAEKDAGALNNKVALFSSDRSAPPATAPALWAPSGWAPLIGGAGALPTRNFSPLRGIAPLGNGDDPAGGPPDGPASISGLGARRAAGALQGPVSPADSLSAEPTAPTGGGLRAVSAPATVVEATLESAPGPTSAAATFYISRAPAGPAELEVPYTLSAFSSTSTMSYRGVAVLSPGSAAVEVPVEGAPVGKPDGHEIVTLRAWDGDGYRVARPTATLFLGGAASRCSEVALLAAYRQGSSAVAFTALAERVRPAVLRACYRVLGNTHDAEDVSQMVLLTLARGQVRLGAALAGWLSTVARNAALAFLRARGRRSRHERRAARRASVESEETSHDLRDELDTALAQLPFPLRQAIQLRYLEGRSQAEAAEQAACPRGTLSRRAAHAARCLRAILGPGRG
jgi:RNA polymerase sigma factor (sigma-70 family)